MPPHGGNSYKLEVGPGDTDLVIIEESFAARSMSMRFSSSIKLGKNALRQVVLNEGTKTERCEGII